LTEGGSELAPSGQRPAWARGDLAWPLALLAGFGGTWAGLATGAPWAAPLLALLLLAPVHLTFVRLGQPGVAAALGMGALVGVGAAIVGAALEGASSELPSALPLAPWLGSEATRLVAGGDAWRPLRATLFHAAAFGAALATARLSRGLGPLLVAILMVGASALGVGELAARAVAAGGSPLVSLLLAWPPPGVVELAAIALCGAALAGDPAQGDRGQGDRGREGRRALLLGGLLLELAALLAWAFAAEPWGRWAAQALGLSGGTG